MRNKNYIQLKIEQIQNLSKSISFHINRNERVEAISTLKEVGEILRDMQVLLNTEIQN